MYGRSHAKVNLSLRIVGRRSDGYHLLQSLFLKLDGLYDDIHVYEHDSLVCECDLLPQSENIVMRVASYMRERFGIYFGALFRINKRIPIGGGLGGGSSNAATAILLLSELWRLNLSLEEQCAIGLRFGCDIPFFLERRKFAFVEGIGEKISEVPSGAAVGDDVYELVLLNTGEHVLTPAVFKQYDAMADAFSPEHEMRSIADEVFRHPNDLTKAAMFVEPKIRENLSILHGYGPVAVKLSGAGTTCWAIFRDKLPDSFLHDMGSVDVFMYQESLRF